MLRQMVSVRYAATSSLLVLLAACSSSSPGNGTSQDAGVDSGSSFVAYDAGVVPCASGQCFTCADATCAAGSYCQSTFPGAAGAKEMGACLALPAACATTTTCGCLSGQASIDHCAMPPIC